MLTHFPFDLKHFTFSVRQDLEDGYYGEEGEDEYEDGEPFAKAANLELSLGTLQGDTSAGEPGLG